MSLFSTISPISLTIKVNPSRAVTFTVKTLTSHNCPPGSQLILGCDVQAAYIQASESDLPDTLQQSSSQLVHTQPVALSPSYLFGALAIPVSSQSATAIRESPGVAENFLSNANNIENHVTLGTTLPPPQSPPQSCTSNPSTSFAPNSNSGAAKNLLTNENNSEHPGAFGTSPSPLQSRNAEPSTSFP
ncbi:hypothetical protein K435DRAFT_968826 [Dendrothele bispora CBS 962.96]|uniref:Uncharacterized protein n=1 Tax=Dendrothele bispora (strain CBS 962.96) TaxID=1314807 RepID=A0A4S8LLT5_DENBC|nr:hypothetical protein K435DRAFT_968826 [Dendrothele bispora CBS 962.96]